MKLISLRRILCLAMIGGAGCQSITPASIGGVFPFYASKTEAQAVAAGQFGAVPIEMPGESDIELAREIPCKSVVAEVRSRAGRLGWIPVDALPQRLQRSSGCATETANQLQGLPAASTPSH